MPLKHATFSLGRPRASRKAEDCLVPLKHAEDGSWPLERLVEPLCSTIHGHARQPFPLVSSFRLASAPLFQMGRSALRSSWTPRRSPAPSVIDLVQFEHRHRASGAERRRRQREDATLTLESNDEPGPTPSSADGDATVTLESNDEPGPTPSSADGEIIGPAGQPTLPLVEPAPGSGVGPAPQPEPSLLGPIVTAPAPGPEPVVQQPVVPTMPVTESVLPPSMLTTDTAPQSPAPKTAPAPATATPPQSRTPLSQMRRLASSFTSRLSSPVLTPNPLVRAREAFMPRSRTAQAKPFLLASRQPSAPADARMVAECAMLNAEVRSVLVLQQAWRERCAKRPASLLAQVPSFVVPTAT